MKLIDLLVQELQKRGGWPDGAICVVQDDDSQLCFSSHSNIMFKSCSWLNGGWCGGWNNPFVEVLADDYKETIVTREQYEAALAAAQQPVWNGKGLPPVGVECEYTLNGRAWKPCKVEMYVGSQGCVMSRDVFEFIQYVHYLGYPKLNFRPIQSMENKKRDAVGEAIYRAINWNHKGDIEKNSRFEDYCKAYDAIAAGKIPGVKLEGL